MMRLLAILSAILLVAGVCYAQTTGGTTSGTGSDQTTGGTGGMAGDQTGGTTGGTTGAGPGAGPGVTAPGALPGAVPGGVPQPGGVTAPGGIPTGPSGLGTGPCPTPGQTLQTTVTPAGPGAGPSMSMPVVAVDQNYIYIVNGNQITKIDKNTLQTGCSATISAPTGAMPGAAGAGPGMGAMSMPAIAVDNTSVYVVSGDSLSKFNKNTLQLETSTNFGGQSTMGAAGAGPGMGMGTMSGAGTAMATGAGTGAGPSGQPAMSGSGPMQMGTSMPRPEVQGLITSLQSLPPQQMEQTYLQSMYQGHLGTIAWSRLAATKAQDPALRKFAKKAAAEETALNNQFLSWGRSWYNISPPATMMSIDRNELNYLQTLSGRQFDIAYIRAMITALSEAIQMSQPVEQKAVHPQLRRTVTNMISAHIRERNQLQKMLGAK